MYRFRESEFEISQGKQGSLRSEWNRVTLAQDRVHICKTLDGFHSLRGHGIKMRIDLHSDFGFAVVIGNILS
jgi:hypothetical protein